MYMLKDDFYNIFGKRYYSQGFISIYQKDLNNIFLLDNTAENNAPYFTNQVLNRKFLNNLEKNIKKKGEDLRDFSNCFKRKNFRILSNKQLLYLYKKFNKRYSGLYVWGWVPNAVDGHHDYFYTKLSNEFKALLSKKKLINKFGQYFTILTSSPSLSLREIAAKDLLNISKKSSREKLINQYVDKYSWLTFNWSGPKYTKKDCHNDLKEIWRDKKHINEKILYLRNKAKTVNSEKRQVIKDLRLSKKLQRQFDTLARLLYIKDLRKNILYQANYNASFLLKEVSRRLNLPLRFVYYILPDEMSNFIFKKESVKKLIDRYELTVLKFSVQKVECLSGKDARIIAGKYLKTLVVSKSGFPLQGQIASIGLARGRVKIVNDSRDIHKVKPGDILVSIKTDPTLLPAMKRAKAIVTEVGGITSHAAIVARELQVPCLIGVKNVSSILKDNQIITVDANKGRICL